MDTQVQIKVSVITVVYNDKDNLVKTIENILSQTYSNIELIVIDGGSTDGTVSVLKNYGSKIKWISEPDNGIYDAMNKGAKLAKSDWLIYRNAGDEFADSTVIETMFAEPIESDISFLCGDCRFVSKYGEIVHTPAILNNNYQGNSMPFLHPSTFIKTECQVEYLYDTSYRSSADFDFFIRCLKNNCKYQYKNIVVANYSYGEGMSVKNWYLVNQENRRVLINNKIAVCSIFFFYYNNIVTFIHNKIKKIVPQKIAHKIIIRNLIREGWKIY